MSGFNELLEDKSFSGIAVVLDKNSNIINANKEFLDLLGFSYEEIYMKHITDLMVPDEKSLFLDLVFIQDVSNVMTIKFYHKTGAFRFFSFRILNLENSKVLIGNTLKKDFLAKKYEYVSENKYKIENIFKNIEADNISDFLTFEGNPLSLLLDIMPIEVWVKDKVGKYVFVNGTYTKATGITMDMCTSKDDYQLFSNDTARSFSETDDLAIKSGKKISFSFETSDYSSPSFAEVTKIPVYNNSGTYIGMFGFSVNTSHTKKSELLLEKEKSRLMYILNNVEGLVFEIDSKSELVFISGKLKELLGVDDTNNDLMSMFKTSSKTIEAREKLKLALSGQKVLVEANIKGTNISFSLNPVLNDEGSYNIIGFGNILHDKENDL